ncbi:MAG: primase-helicase zinc-binding domain-containing protein, partial [bacterium]
MSFDAATIKQAASGRWREILTDVGGVPADRLDGQNASCPRCGGVDRFRYIDEEAGAVLCNQCFTKGNGDGLSALQWLRGWTLDETCKQLAGYLGLTNGSGRPEPAPSPRPGSTDGKPRITARYPYHDEAGNLIFEVVRREPGAGGRKKDFRQRKPDGKGGWTWSAKGCPVVPYRLPELLAEPSRSVVVCEGEKDVDALRGIGLLATCNPGGAGKWRPEHAQFLAGRRVVV